MNRIEKLFVLVLVFNIAFSTSLFSQQGAVFSKKAIKSMHQEFFAVGRPSQNQNQESGSFRDFDGNYYLYGQYDGQGNITKIDKANLSGLNDEKYILIKYDSNYIAQWAHVFGNHYSRMYNLKIIQGFDSLIYIFATSYDDFSIGGLTINNMSREQSTYVARLDPITGKAIDGYCVSKEYLKYSLTLADAIIDKDGNIYLALEAQTGTIANKPDSIRFGKFSAPWRHNTSGISDVGIIVKLDTNQNPVWFHSIGATNYFNVRLSLSGSELIVCGNAGLDLDNWNWRKIYFDDELLIDVTYNSPYGQMNNGFLIKLDSSGVKKWMWPWFVKFDLDDSPGIQVMDMKSDKGGNTYCYLFMGDLETKFDSSWIHPKVRTAVKMAKFNNEGYLEWIREPEVIVTIPSEYPKTRSNHMFLDKYGNSYYSFMFTGSLEEFSIDSIKFSLPIKFMDEYWGLLKLDTDGNAVDAIFSPIADKKNKTSFDNSFKLTYVDDQGIIYQPLGIRVYDDTFYVYGKDTLYMDYDSAYYNMYINTFYFVWNEITPKSQIIKELRHPSCANSNDGYIHLKVIGGFSGHYLKWDHGSTDMKLDNLSRGTYIVSLYDSFSQQTSIDTIILFSPSPLIGSVQIKDDTNNLSLGSINLNIQGGTPPYSYKWDDPKNSTTASINQIASGSYSVTVTDHNKCTWDTTVTVNNKTNSIKDLLLNELSIYPNPSKDGSLFIKMLNPSTETIEVIILDAKGQECYHSIFQNGSNGIYEAIPVQLQKGNYIVKIIDGKKHHLRKISII